MQLSTITLSAALFMGSALAQQMVTTHVVRVGSLAGNLTFMPSQLTAAAGDMVQFQFAPKNHSVVQSTFDQPCQPSRLNSNITGLYSGYIAVAADAEMTATWTVQLNDTRPLWLYCSQARHCQNGMVMVINPPAANASRTLENYKTLAAAATVNLGGDAVTGGVGSNSTTPGSDSGSGTPADGGSATSPGVTGPSNISAASTLRVGGAAGLAGVLAVAFAVLL